MPMWDAKADQSIEVLRGQAREAYVAQWRAIRWDYWARLEDKSGSIVTVTDHLERLVRDLHRAASPQILLVAGIHLDPYPHAHGLISLTRRWRARFLSPQEFREWLQRYWYHGEVWAEAYDAERRHKKHGGAIEYLARHPESVVWG